MPLAPRLARVLARILLVKIEKVGDFQRLNADDYAYLKNVTLGSWAWEFARRWPDYANAHADHREGALTRTNRPCGMEVLELSRPEPDAARFGLSFFVSPRRSCLDAPIFWTEEANHRVTTVDVRAVEPSLRDRCLEGLFNFSRLTCRRSLFIDYDGTQHLRIVYCKRSIQLRCEGDSLLLGDVDLRFMLRFFGPVDAKIETLRRLKMVYDGFLPEQPAGPHWTSTALGLRDALIALDVHLEGGSHRDAAMVIYGEKDGIERYKSPDESVRNRMRRLRKKGLLLMHGGYLDLMNPARSAGGSFVRAG